MSQTSQRGAETQRKATNHGLRWLTRFPKRCDAAAGALLGAMLATVAAGAVAVGAPSASADKHQPASAASSAPSIDKKFKGHLPITELTEDEAIVHALNRLAYGPRPGDVEQVRQMGLEKWLDQQLNPDSIDDSALDQRLEKYPTLRKS